MINTIIFDAFGTLFQVTSGGSAEYIRKQIMTEGYAVDEKEFLNEWRNYYRLRTDSHSVFRTEREIFVSRIQMFYDRYGIERNAGADADYLLAGAYERKAYEEVAEVLERLRQRYQVFIGSNTDNDVLDTVMKKNGIVVDKVYTSENLKCYKPAPEFYRKILAENGLNPEEVLFVGDSLKDDVYGPQKEGMYAVWVNRGGKGMPEGEREVKNLRELIRNSALRRS